MELDAALAPALATVLARLRRQFDLDARPDVITGQLRADAQLMPLIRRSPGLRVPGAFDGFELAVRTIVGQRVSVRGASTLAGRLAEAFGEAIETPHAALNRLAPTACRLAEVRPSRIAALGIASERTAAIQQLARAVADERIRLSDDADPEVTADALQELPGIGPWTAGYIVMRALGWPDAWPDGDLGLLKAAGTRSPRELSRRAEAWRPWRVCRHAAMGKFALELEGKPSWLT